MRQLVHIIFISNSRPSCHFWWKENLVKHQKVSKYYENDCSLVIHEFWKLLGESVNIKLTHDGFSGFLKEIGSLIRLFEEWESQKAFMQVWFSTRLKYPNINNFCNLQKLILRFFLIHLGNWIYYWYINKIWPSIIIQCFLNLLMIGLCNS